MGVAIKINGEKRFQDVDRTVLIGREPAADRSDLTIVLDAKDMGISRRAVAVAPHDGRWTVHNLSARNPVFVHSPLQGLSALGPGEFRLVAAERFEFEVHGLIRRHHVLIEVPAAEVAMPSRTQETLHSIHPDTVTMFRGRSADDRAIARDRSLPSLSDREFLALVAVASPMLEGFPRRQRRPLTYAAAADRLGWDRIAVRKAVADHVVAKAAHYGFVVEGRHAVEDLIQSLIGAGVLGPDDLLILNELPETS